MLANFINIYFISYYARRSFYTQRILSIVANVKKQNEEMNRVIEDVKLVQREINGLQGKIERTFAVTDGMIFAVCTKFGNSSTIYELDVFLAGGKRR